MTRPPGRHPSACPSRTAASPSAAHGRRAAGRAAHPDRPDVPLRLGGRRRCERKNDRQRSGEDDPLHGTPPSVTRVSRRGRETSRRRNTLWCVGQEIACTASSDGRRAEGRAQLETDELLFRGDGLRCGSRTRRSPTCAQSRACSRLTTTARRPPELGDKAARWADRIKNPKTVIDKLGVKPGQRVALRGMDADGFAGDLAARGAELVERDADHLFVAVETPTTWRRSAASSR